MKILLTIWFALMLLIILLIAIVIAYEITTQALDDYQERKNRKNKGENSID